MSLHLYNTLTRAKEPFTPINARNVRLYVCGPTVYDYAHIGNARPVVVFDVLYRLLRHIYGAEQVTYVRNITDVDDKINARAKRDYPDLPLNDAIAKVTAKTADQFHADVAALGCLEPTHEPRATQHIGGMIAMIQQLLDQGIAYVARGEEGREALFDVKKMTNYGALSKRKLGDQKAGARIAVEPHKRNPEDFVLWKESAADEPGWPATFTLSSENQAELQLNDNEVSIFGRPGWHIECSVMSAHHLGETFDIHGGGLDLIFPHHENEIAQSCCAHGTDRMANVWMHNGFVQVEGRKMSKSEGNFVTIHDVLHTDKVGGRSWPGEVVRLALLMTHYREPLDFSVKRLEEAEGLINGWADTKMLLNRSFGPEMASWSIKDLGRSSIVDDLNTVPLFQELQRIAKSARAGEKTDAISFVLTLHLLGFDDIEGLSSEVEKTLGFEDEFKDEIEATISKRLALIADKNWAEADRIRDELLEQGIQLKDSKDPETGERITTWEVKR